MLAGFLEAMITTLPLGSDPAVESPYSTMTTMVGMMRDFMGKRSVIAVGIIETLKCRHLNRIGGEAVKPSVSAMSDGCARRCENRSLIHPEGLTSPKRNPLKCRRCV